MKAKKPRSPGKKRGPVAVDPYKLAALRSRMPLTIEGIRKILLLVWGPVSDAAETLFNAIQVCEKIEPGSTKFALLPEATMLDARKSLDFICEVYLPMQRRAAWVNAGNLCRHCGKKIPAERLTGC